MTSPVFLPSSVRARGEGVLHIAASQHSAPFFARFGAVDVATTPDGRGPGTCTART